MRENVLFDTDSYKATHARLYRPGVQSMFSYIEARHGGLYDKICYAGIQGELKNYYVGSVISPSDVDEARQFYKAHMNIDIDYDGWMYVARDLQGKLPVRIRAIPEGSIVPEGIPLLTIESTDSRVPFIASWLETKLLRCWGSTNVATLGYNIKKDFVRFLRKSSDEGFDSLDFKLHDFGSRGVDCQESSQVSGFGHLINYRGSDNISAIRYANRYYNCPMSGFSIPASEHSTITSWGQDREMRAYENMLSVYAKPGAMLACVSDSYNIFNAVEKLWGTELRQKVTDSGATLVIRPDSGDPHFMVVDTLQRLDAKFGHTLNSKGFKVLNHVRVIQGDGVTHAQIVKILETMMMLGFSIDNVAFGMGGALLRKHDKDTQRHAMKCSSVNVGGNDIDVFKNPVTDPGKKSMAGRLDAVFDERNEHIEVVQLPNGVNNHHKSILRTVFEDGELLVDDTLTECRKRAKKGPF